MGGKILTVESMGLVDGPGIRTVVFFQGCALRCKFCHNPDSWSFTEGKRVTVDELLKQILRFRPYFERSGGGVTCSGGEPLLQPQFLLELLKACKQENIHTCLDTAGVGLGEYDEILAYTDLVLYDVKDYRPDEYFQLCGRKIDETERFQLAIKRANVPVTVRQVLIPDHNDTEAYLNGLQAYIKHNLPTAQKVELLPYHKMGVVKYPTLGLSDPLDGVPPMDKERATALQNLYFHQEFFKK